MRPEAGHSMMARRSSTPGRAKRTMRRALPDRRRGRPRCTCPTCMRRNRTSRPESRASALYPSRPTCNGRRHCPSRSRREQKRRARTRNEADKEGLGAQSCGRSQTLLYNTIRRHSTNGYLSPVEWSYPALVDGLGLRRACLGHRVSFRIRWAKDSPGPSGGVRDCRSLR